MENNKKASRMLDVNYIGPYSQSWAGMKYPKRSKVVNVTTSKINRNVFAGRKTPSLRNVLGTRTYVGSDPTVPHLKYGLFPKKSLARNQPRIANEGLAHRTAADVKRDNASLKTNRCIVEAKFPNIERPVIAKASTVHNNLQNPYNQSLTKGELDTSPTFVFRPLKYHDLYVLTVSTSNHLDIKPHLQLYRK